MRALREETEFKRLHLPKEPFNERSSKGVMRERIRHKELGGEYSTGGYRTENERINHAVFENSMKDPSGWDSKMIIQPSWKEDCKERWISLVGFVHLEKAGSQHRQASAEGEVRALEL